MMPLMTEAASPMTPVTDDGLHARWKNNSKRYRVRRQRGLRRLPAVLSSKQIDSLEEKGYLDPDRRGERLDECDAIELFLADALAKSR